jgi:hypothetical protein
MPRIAILVSLPLASPAESFLGFSAGSTDVSTSGTFKMAAKPLVTSANFHPAEGLRKPVDFPVISGMMYATVAIIEKRPCLSSV